MADKCASHDECFRRLFSKMESLEANIDGRLDKLTEALHAGAIRFTQIDMRLAQLEAKAARPKTVDWTQFFVDLLKDALRFGFFAGGAAAWWAIRNGYNG